MRKVLLAAALGAALGVSVGATAMADPLPAGPGRNVVIAKCSSCHATALIENERHDADGWQDAIDKMVDRGLVISDAERGQVVAYLARVLGPQAAPAAKPASAPAKPAAKVVVVKTAAKSKKP
ncbi:hypothetical protein [Caulobacter segnis]|uniref:hypothetical protein n=1 Tax=Caulobacter segnis TaxID=88688 RepID=UPI001CBECDC3|nr:hypothetical protein [Caulobacter segnis]UAL09504.1 hypothetical protein K8940_17210 [Caulobacter segnis]